MSALQSSGFRPRVSRVDPTIDIKDFVVDGSLAVRGLKEGFQTGKAIIEGLDEIRALPGEREAANMKLGAENAINAGTMLTQPGAAAATFAAQQDANRVRPLQQQLAEGEAADALANQKFNASLQPENQNIARTVQQVAANEAAATLTEQKWVAQVREAMKTDPFAQFSKVVATDGTSYIIDNLTRKTIHVSTPDSGLSPAEKAVDEAFAKNYADELGGGTAQRETNISELSDAVSTMGLTDNVSGALIGAFRSVLPNSLQPVFGLGKAVQVEDQVAGVVQQSLRQILGGQFAMREGEALIRRAFNPSLPEAENIRRATILKNTLLRAQSQQRSASEYFRQNGTLRGYQGPVPTLASIIDGFDRDMDPPPGSGESASDRDMDPPPGSGESASSPAPKVPPGGRNPFMPPPATFQFKDGDEYFLPSGEKFVVVEGKLIRR
jgi:hypothetical protein